MKIKVVENPIHDAYKIHYADCLIKTHNDKILIQKRPENWHSNAGGYNLFGGHVESGETIIEGVIREIKEETGALIQPEELFFIGCISEDFTNHTELVHIYFWHDRHSRITGCYEAEAAYFENAQDILKAPNVMEYTIWTINECMKRGLIE